MSKQHYQKGYKGAFCFIPKHSYFYDWLHKSMGRKSYLEINIANKKELSSVVTIKMTVLIFKAFALYLSVTRR